MRIKFTLRAFQAWGLIVPELLWKDGPVLATLGLRGAIELTTSPN